MGHSLTGLAVLGAVIPVEWIRSRRKLLIASGCFVLLANAPDAPFPGWGHERYDISHSVFSTALGVAISVVLYRLLLRSGSIPRLPEKIIVGGAVAWFSHLLLDSFYNHGNGIPVMWPFGAWRLNLPIPCFDLLFPKYEMVREPLQWLTPHALRVMGIEALFYGTVLLGVVGVRWLVEKRSTNPKLIQ